MVMACVYALLLWYHATRVIPEQRAITGCKHTRGHLTPTVKHERTGNPTALTWFCDSCSFQHQLPRLNRLPNGTWWLLDEEVSPLEHPDDSTEGQGGEGGVRPEA